MHVRHICISAQDWYSFYVSEQRLVAKTESELPETIQIHLVNHFQLVSSLTKLCA